MKAQVLCSVIQLMHIGPYNMSKLCVYGNLKGVNFDQ